MMTTVITPNDVRDLSVIADAMYNLFEGEYARMWGFCGDRITVSYDDKNPSELYNVYSKLDFLEFSVGMGEGVHIQWDNGPAVLAGLCEENELKEA